MTLAVFEERELESQADRTETRRTRPWLEALALALVLGFALALRTWKLGQNGYGSYFYAATVRSMLASWRNFFYGAFDPRGFISVDKPPVAFWVQAAFAKVFGFHGWALLLPQALEGVATIGLIYVMVRRAWGKWPALLAALMLAVTPVSVAIDRDNLPDSCLVLVLVMAAWAMLRATETGKGRWLFLAMSLVGVAFNVKMLVAFGVLPTFYALYFLAAPVGWMKKLGRLSVATIVLAAVSLSWATLIDLTPATKRPYVGDTTNNSMFSLVFGSNGLERLTGRQGGPGMPPGANGRQPGGPPGGGTARLPGGGNGDFRPPFGPGDGPPGFMGGPPGRRGGPGAGGPPPFGGGQFQFGINPMGSSGSAGPLRLLNHEMAGQITWLIPLAIAGVFVGLFSLGWRARLTARQHFAFLWGGWLLTYAVVFSYSRGTSHPYYVSMLAPPIAALSAAAVASLWSGFRRTRWLMIFLPMALALTAALECYILRDYPEWRKWLYPTVGAVVTAATLSLLILRMLSRMIGKWPQISVGAVAIALAALLICPTALALTAVLAPGDNHHPHADPSLLRIADSVIETRNRNLAAADKLADFLRANRHGERYFLAVPSDGLADTLIIRTGEAVMPIGGYMGNDPVITVEQFAQLVQSGQLRYVLINGGPGFGPGMGFGGPPGFGPGGPGFGGPPGFDGPSSFGPLDIPGPRPGHTSSRRRGSAAGGPPGRGGNGAIFQWVREHGQVVDPSLWRSADGFSFDPSFPFPNRRRSRRNAGASGGRTSGGAIPRSLSAFGVADQAQGAYVGNCQLYDCRPEATQDPQQ